MHRHEHGFTDERRMLVALVLTGGFMVAEIIGGLISGALALLADAGHMLTDTAALAMAFMAARMGRRPADALRSYGYHRLQILAAFVNGLAFVAIVGWILVEAVQRLLAPHEILGDLMLVVAVLGLLVNIVAFAVLHPGARTNLNLRGAAVHVLGDLLGSVAAITAAVVILLTGWTPVDPLLSVVVALLILRSAWVVVRESAHVLLEGTPQDVDVALLRATLRDSSPAIQDIHHVHVWSLTPERPLLTLHVRIGEGADCTAVLHEVKRVLAERFGIRHSTIQVEQGTCVDEHAPG